MTRPRVGLILVAAGSSRRMNGVDKVWSLVSSRPLLWYSMAELSPAADMTVLVTNPSLLDTARLNFSGIVGELQVVGGGERRQDSVAKGIEALGKVDFVAVHDAARPLVTLDLLSRGLELMDSCSAAIPTIPVPDTLKTVDEEGTILGTVDRDRLRGAQTPQVFRYADLRQVHELASHTMTAVTDDAALLETAGYRVKSFDGSPLNFKVTTPFDLEIARLLLELRAKN